MQAHCGWGLYVQNHRAWQQPFSSCRPPLLLQIGSSVLQLQMGIPCWRHAPIPQARPYENDLSILWFWTGTQAITSVGLQKSILSSVVKIQHKEQNQEVYQELAWRWGSTAVHNHQGVSSYRRGTDACCGFLPLRERRMPGSQPRPTLVLGPPKLMPNRRSKKEFTTTGMRPKMVA